MVEIIDGNLLDFPNDIGFIAHSCNTSNLMGAGIARQKKIVTLWLMKPTLMQGMKAIIF